MDRWSDLVAENLGTLEINPDRSLDTLEMLEIYVLICSTILNILFFVEFTKNRGLGPWGWSAPVKEIDI